MPNSRQYRRKLIALLALFVAAIVGGSGAAPAQATPRDNYITLPKATYPKFYVPPSPLPAGKPGDLIRWRTMSFQRSLEKPPRGSRGYMMMYLSTSATGEPIAVTAYLIIPDGHPPRGGVENRPIVGYGNEAMGLGDNCAQSRVLEWGKSGEITLFAPMLKLGYAVVASDYEGLGTPAVHTFGVAKSAAHSILDSIRAARNLQEAMLPKDGPVALFGYSQGGQGVASGAELQPTYAPDVKLTAVAAGGVPIDPAKFTRYNSGKFFSAVNFAASAGYDAAYPELNLREEFLNERGLKGNDAAMNACIESTFAVPFRMSSAYLKPGKDPVTDPRWVKRFKENTPGAMPPQDVPVLYFHAIGDQASPYSAATQLRRDWCGGGTNLSFYGIPLFEHVSTGPVYMPEAAKWVRARFEGRPATGNCGPSKGQNRAPASLVIPPQ